MQKIIKRNYLILFFKGLAMGAADVVPGVSGGTIAFISGIYEELLESINQVNFSALKKWKHHGFKHFWAQINGNFLTALFLGILVSVVSLAKGITYLLEHHAILLWSFFFGLVIASIIFIGKSIDQKKIPDYFMALLGVAIAVGIGALNAVHERDLLIIAIVGAGCVVGLASFSRVLKWTLKRYKNQTLSILIGFIIGSLAKIWPWKEVTASKRVGDKEIVMASENIMPWNFSGEAQILSALILAIIGFSLIFILEKSASKKNPEAS